MSKHYITLLSAILLLSIGSYSQKAITTGSGGKQTKGMKVKWTTSPFDNQVFIENKGQFDGIIPGGKKVFYVVNLGDIQAFFTGNGIVYRMKKYPKLDFSHGQDPDKDGAPKPVISYQYSEWSGASNSATIAADEEQSYYYTYPSGISNTIKTSIYKKITYKNIYPGIDVEYSFKEGRQGIEYKLIVHPEATISLAKLLYSGKSSSKLKTAGDIDISTGMGVYNMSEPQGYYEDSKASVKVSYSLKGNEESFLVKDRDPSKTLVIDPWITDPLFTTYDKAYDMDYDNYGNVYAYGGNGNPYQLEKFNSSGSPQWIFNATTLVLSTNYYGDLAVDRVTAESYLTEGWNAGGGARCEKVNTLGFLMATFPGNNLFAEMYRAEYDACNRDIIIAGGGTSFQYQACVLDTSMVSIVPVNTEGVSTGYHDIAFLGIDPQGDTCYMATTQSLLYTTIQNNYLLKLPLPALSPSVLDLNDGLAFHELNSMFYVGDGTQGQNGYNGMAVSPNWLYLYDGDTLKQMNKFTGALNAQRQMTNKFPTYMWGGLDVDACDNLFVGFKDSIKLYNGSLVAEDSLAMHKGDTIFDLHLGQNDIMYACGLHFVSAIAVPAKAKLISTSVGFPTTCLSCDGKATVTVNCGIAPFKFLWSNGSTNQTDTGLCAGLYTITVTDASCPPRIDSAVVNVAGKPGYTVNVTDTNPGCVLSQGVVTAYVHGGTIPYTYLWNTGGTTSHLTGLSAGTYTCVVIDNDGCKTSVLITLINPPPPSISVYPLSDSVCIGSSLGITASGVKTYSWLPNTGLSCYNCPNPTASPTTTTTYTVTGVDSNGCSATATTTVKVNPIPKPVITGKDTICAGTRDTLRVSGGTTYIWTVNGSTNNYITGIPSVTTTYTVESFNGFCQKDTTFTIHVVPAPTALVSASKDSVCSGDTLTLWGSGGTTYRWSPGGSTKTTIHVSPSTSTTYTLYTYGGTCKDSTTIKINIAPLTTAVISQNDTICPGGVATITATGSGGTFLYKWNTGQTTSSINVSPATTTTYTATVLGRCDSVHKSVTVVVEPLPIPLITGLNWKCKGVKDTLKISGGCSYLWNDGSTKTSIITGGINADSTFYVTVKNCFGCSVRDSFKVSMRVPVSVTINNATLCSGDCFTLTATAGGSGLQYLWSNGATTDTTTVCPSSTSTYSVTVSNGCPTKKTTTVQVYSTTIYACCDTLITKGDSAIIRATSASNYKWFPPTGLNCDTCATVIATPSLTTTYTVIGTDSHGCQESHVITITVDIPCFNIRVPNVITPNYPGPFGVNNEFYIKTENISNWSIYIYDRWGKEMFHSTDPNKYWDGKTEGGSDATDGVYYYILSGVCQNTTYKYDGFLQVIR